MKDGNVYLGSITHNGQMDFRVARTFFNFACRDRGMMQKIIQGSLLARSCNNLWCDALNLRAKENFKWFVLLHADIIPEKWFVEKLIGLAEKHNADVMSAVVPIKDYSGITSTAISGPSPFYGATRLTNSQILDSAWPATFDINDARKALRSLPDELKFQPMVDDEKMMLLVNTGCVAIRLDREWCSEVCFAINDRISQGLGGTFYEETEPEDWYFSRRVHESGGKVMATREVVVEHVGTLSYRSDQKWGRKIDPQSVGVKS